jgi:hypothetical protein
MIVALVPSVIVASACGGSREPLVRRPQSYEDHLASAKEHAARADARRRTAPADERDPTHPSGYQCGDVALSDQTTSGGERLVQAVPCWDTTEKSVAQHRWGAADEDRLADAERREAASLLEAERTACRGLRRRDLEHSPFAHRREIAEVVPHRAAGVLRGVRIVWKPVLGLTAGWMQQAIACHRARFERLGEPATYLPEDPTLVANATVTVEQRGDHIEVLIETRDATSSHVALGRAMDLVGPRTATR